MNITSSILAGTGQSFAASDVLSAPELPHKRLATKETCPSRPDFTHARSMIGIDVVDLRYTGVPAYQHVRYLRRVSSADERIWVRSWGRPDLALSVLWAAKEAAYKALSRLHVEEPFVPAEVSVSWDGSQLVGRCDWKGRSARVQGRIDEDHACAMALRAGTVSYAWNISRIGEERSLTPAEESLAARNLAAGLLERAGYSNAEIRRAGNGKPWISGINRVSVSLSHHGRWAAAAIAVEVATSGEGA